MDIAYEVVELLQVRNAFNYKGRKEKLNAPVQINHVIYFLQTFLINRVFQIQLL